MMQSVFPYGKIMTAPGDVINERDAIADNHLVIRISHII